MPVLDLLSRMTADSIEAARLESRTWIIARIAALVAGRPPASYLANLGAASDLDVGVEDVRGVLLAIAPVVGTVRIVSALGNIRERWGSLSRQPNWGMRARQRTRADRHARPTDSARDPCPAASGRGIPYPDGSYYTGGIRAALGVYDRRVPARRGL